MIKIILADDHDLVRTGIRRILEDESEFSVIAEAKNGEEAVQLCRKNAPDVRTHGCKYARHWRVRSNQTYCPYV